MADPLAARLDRVVTILEEHGTRLDRVEGRLDRVVSVLEAHDEHLLALDATVHTSNRLLEHIVEQLRHMNDALIRTLTVRGEIDELRARVVALEARNGR